MDPETAQTAATTVAALAPFLPYLVKAGEKAAEKAGEVVFDTAKVKVGEIWRRISEHFKGNPKVETALKAVEVDPDNETARSQLREYLVASLAADPSFLRELKKLLDEPEVEQVITAVRSRIENTTQESHGSGSTRQVIQAEGSSVVTNTHQKIQR
jgi:hypothetical protein